MRKIFVYALMFMVVLLAGCAGQPVRVDVPYNPKTDARLRASTLKLFMGKACYPSKFMGVGENATLAAGADWRVLARSTTVGMPVAVDSPQRYSEYVVKAGEPITLQGGYKSANQYGPQQACGPVRGTFIPQAGKNYEAAFGWDGGRCWINMRELLNNNGVVSAQKVTLSSPSKCQ